MSRSAEFGQGITSARPEEHPLTDEQRLAEHHALIRRMQDEDRDHYQSDWDRHE